MGLSDVAEDIAFHMTDWDHNVDDLVSLYERPEAFSDDEIMDIILKFWLMFRTIWQLSKC